MAEKKKEQQDNLRFYEQLRNVPKEALKSIGAGRLKGMSDVNPMWRIKVMTETFGPCGFGWKYEITKQWHETYGQEIKAFCNVNLYIKINGEWSDAIPGTGGSSFVAVEKSGPYVSDECEKMSLTDALSVAMKALGVAADVYFSKDPSRSQFDTKYEQQSYQSPSPAPAIPRPVQQQPQQIGLPVQIQNEINAAQTNDALLAVWNKYSSLWQDANFSGAVTARKDQIMNNGKS